MEKPAFTSPPTDTDSRLANLSRKDRIKGILRYCRERVEENNLSDVAGNISFTIILSLVPMLAIMLAIFTTFPEFGTLQYTLETYFAQGMIPCNIARTILNYLGAFASNAANVSIVGGLALLFTTLTTISTIESAFDRIWHIMTPRPLIKRIILYIAIAVFAPLLLGISIYLTTHLVLSKHGLVGWLPVLDTISAPLIAVIWTTIAFTLLYRILPHRLVLWKDAAAGGLFAAVAFEIAIRLFAFFIVNFSSYERIYGALAAFPIFMMWIYISSLIMLLGALVAALLPDIRNGRWNAASLIGGRFSDAMKIIGVLYNSGQNHSLVVSRTELERQTHLSVSETEYCLTKLEKLGWATMLKRSMISTVSFRKRGPREWKWIGDARKITVADVFRQFVFAGNSDDHLTLEVDKIIDNGLNLTLADYFDIPEDSLPEKPEAATGKT
ncbi:YihY family inner membrane protein [Oxalobacter aliiformigenes]|uniref:YihY family inner membrane protein n=1 Tax=Oxalobacter aliiformigenes TaxID=2946593 RepID=UPI0022AF6523|nr:YihY family inner membrane protein [Oxalobacter aliiformigenes]MCZ4064697.1 YihY family inner membrane protein [Oxalobacter aliiformigenes]WAV99931.1 YihY family inner membrane protein [Oxalobacter aliiformigenes]